MQLKVPTNRQPPLSLSNATFYNMSVVTPACPPDVSDVIVQACRGFQGRQTGFWSGGSQPSFASHNTSTVAAFQPVFVQQHLKNHQSRRRGGGCSVTGESSGSRASLLKRQTEDYGDTPSAQHLCAAKTIRQ